MSRLFALLLLVVVIAISSVSSQYVYSGVGYAGVPAYGYGVAGYPAYSGLYYKK
ncbi:hypothetical protein Ocin01_09343 [Orchesella cincta]|uniref:Uncharacterized protein n=1 Tax=Orchesella cincta TaxID=48709 RepID=A0A1D2MWM6_ORCCI|nr:hypothetical protein Ocin01_09343 [Orchesella cincta]